MTQRTPAIRIRQLQQCTRIILSFRVQISPKIFCRLWNHVSKQFYLHPPHILGKMGGGTDCVNVRGSKTETCTDGQFANIRQENRSANFV